MAEVERGDGVVLFHGSGSDHEIVKWKHVTLSCFLTCDASDEPSSPIRNRMDWEEAHKFIDVLASVQGYFRRLCAIDSMYEFCDGEGRQREVERPMGCRYRLNEASNRLFVTHGGDDCT